MSDHGEELFDHGRWVYEKLLRTLLVLRLPGQIPHARVEALTENIDIGATLLDYAGVTRTFGQGYSMRPPIEGRSSAIKRNTLAVSSLEHLYPRVPELLAPYSNVPCCRDCSECHRCRKPIFRRQYIPEPLAFPSPLDRQQTFPPPPHPRLPILHPLQRNAY